MKNFITSKWIPVVFASIFILSLLLLRVVGSLTEEVVVILLSVIYVPMIFLYFPTLAIVSIKTNHPKKHQIIGNIGLFCLILWLLGLISKIHLNWYGSPLHIIAGSFIFLTSFLPAWYALKIAESQAKLKLFYFLLTNFYGALILYGCSSTQHFPFWENTMYFCFFSSIVLLPFLIYHLIKGNIQFNFKNNFTFIFFIAYILGMRQMVYMRDLRNSSVNVNQEEAEKNFTINERKANFIYEAFSSTHSSDSLFLSNYAKVKTIKTAGDSLQKYVSDLKSVLVVEVAALSKSVADTIKLKKISAAAKANYDIPTNILFDSIPKFKHIENYNIYSLKKRLLSFSDTLISLSPQEFKTQLKQYNPIQIVDQNDYEDGMQLTWEVTQFSHRPLGIIYTQLTSIQSDIFAAEILVMNELFNKANQNRKENLAAQLTEVSLKYETEKKEKQISLLEKDKELNDAKLMAKDVEISQTRETLIYFVFALVIFVVLIVFVIRANLQRRKANQLLTQQKLEIEKQKHLVDEKQKEIVDSITYAKRLQHAILPPQEFINQFVPNNFVLYKPKDIVAGDFYWAEQVGDKFFIAAADSTGHGVPGAMVSVVCSNALNRAIKEFKLNDTGKILNKTRELVLETFEKSSSEVKDGMDISLFCIDSKNKNIFWSGANNPLWYIQDNELKEIKANKQAIGKTDNPVPFTTHQIDYKENTLFYLFTDGFADQFGGANGKKFKYKQFEELLVSISSKPMQEQSDIINKIFEDWKGSLEQVDDVCVIGIKI
ncbi:SpoIIE family protein phosphatase [Aurantibacillus circumpalustris]|uniref:SpoIIE family protein phosphatase n=1 Tax=Aurantibacillus circumpalustris TaxID=3036359 RepID=UPI00295BD924|nr:SpoIIE family protein phosphatase [Aurantibacillus circumpalustris]